jgi:phosphoglycerate kinase
MNWKTLTDIPHLIGVKVLLRVDFNVPIKDDVVADDFRIRAAMPSIDFLRGKGARIILISHIESAEGAKGEIQNVFSTLVRDTKSKVQKPSLAPVADYLHKKGIPVIFQKKWTGAFAASEQLKDGEILLLENIRENEGEKNNDPVFAKQLATLADIYVNDAFSVSHREHASVCAITVYLPSYAGLQLVKEVENLSRAFSPKHLFLFILGGAKFDTKLPLLEKFSTSANTIFIGGALANDALKAQGYQIGRSKTSDGSTDISGIISQPCIVLPVDVVVQDHSIKRVGKVAAGYALDVVDMEDVIVDVGPASLAALKEKIDTAQFILWNGPFGLFEKGFTQGTEEVAKMIVGATTRGAQSIIGGGDTLSAIAKLGIEDQFTFVSGGGGAMLDFLAHGTLLGIEALKKNK